MRCSLMSHQFCTSLYINIVLSHLWTITKSDKLIHVTFNTQMNIYKGDMVYIEIPNVYIEIPNVYIEIPNSNVI